MSTHRDPGGLPPNPVVGGPDEEEGATRVVERARGVGRGEGALTRMSYRIGRRLGSGGFAEVYEAEPLREVPAGPGDADWPARVALKRLLPGMRADPMRRRLLIREAHIACQLVHENIVRALGLVEMDDELAIVMELVEGVSASLLLHRLARRSERLTLGSIVYIMQGLFAALSYLENPQLLGRRPLVHADISLENVMITTSGQVKLIDFGIAGLDHSVPVDDEEGLTSIHQVSGKRSYAPPEGPRAAPTVSGDLYAAGVCFWELISGFRFPVLPGGVGPREVGSLIAFAAEGLPEGVWTTLKHCLAVDPTARPGSAAHGHELMQTVAPGESLAGEALGRLVRGLLGKEPASAPTPDWPRASEPHDLFASLVERLHSAFCAHRVLAYEPVPPGEIESMGGHEFILRAERGASGPAIEDFLLRETLDAGQREEDGTLLFRVHPPGAPPHVLVVQPGQGCIYDPLAQKILANLLRPEATTVV